VIHIKHEESKEVIVIADEVVKDERCDDNDSIKDEIDGGLWTIYNKPDVIIRRAESIETVVGGGGANADASEYVGVRDVESQTQYTVEPAIVCKCIICSPTDDNVNDENDVDMEGGVIDIDNGCKGENESDMDVVGVNNDSDKENNDPSSSAGNQIANIDDVESDDNDDISNAGDDGNDRRDRGRYDVPHDDTAWELKSRFNQVGLCSCGCPVYCCPFCYRLMTHIGGHFCGHHWHEEMLVAYFGMCHGLSQVRCHDCVLSSAEREFYYRQSHN
jgi:hypothetical protein